MVQRMLSCYSLLALRPGANAPLLLVTLEPGSMASLDRFASKENINAWTPWVFGLIIRASVVMLNTFLGGVSQTCQ
jgi:hypothetical protein